MVMKGRMVLFVFMRCKIMHRRHMIIHKKMYEWAWKTSVIPICMPKGILVFHLH